MDQLVAHWWNRSWGTATRRDLWIYECTGGWRASMREGSDEHRVVSRIFADRVEAERILAFIRSNSGDTWKDISPSDRAMPR